MQLSTVQRLKLLRQDILASLRIGANVPVKLEETPDGVFVLVEGWRVAVPSPLRWKLYRQGWQARLDRLECEYGVGRHAALSPGSVVIDVGANVGEFAHVCARYGARTISVEPDPKVFACLLQNLEDLPAAAARDEVIWKEDGDIDFALAPDRADSSVFAEGPRIKKKAVTIETLALEYGLTRIDLIKCDAEGAEPEVLQGIGAAWPLVRAVALDTGPERKGARTDADCRAILQGNGLRTIDEKIGSRMMTFGVRG